MEPRIVLRPGTPTEQANALCSVGLRPLLQIAAADYAIGAAIVSLAFVSKPFLESALKELGKDVYGWAKTKLGFERAQKYGQINVDYHISVGNISFIDDKGAPFSQERHEQILSTVHSLAERLGDEGSLELDRVKLTFDPDQKKYTEAKIYLSGTRDGAEIIEVDPETDSFRPAWELRPPLQVLKRLPSRAGTVSAWTAVDQSSDGDDEAIKSADS